jgi:hypothetical protein
VGSSAILFGLLLVVPAAVADMPTTTQASRLVTLEAETPRTVFIGLPLVVAVTIKNDGAQPVELPVWHVMGAHPPITFVAQDKDGHSYTSPPTRFVFTEGEVETTMGPRPIMKRQWSLGPGDSFHCAVNLGWILRERVGMPPGEYRVHFVLWRSLSQSAAESKPTTLTVADRPDGQMKGLLAKVTVDYSGVSRKKGVTLSPADVEAIREPELRGTVAFAVLMDAAASAHDPADVPIADYEKMIEPYLLPEVQMLEWTCRTARQDEDGADKVATQLIEKCPSMRTRLKLARGDQTFLLLSEPMRKRLKDTDNGPGASKRARN